MLFNFNECTIYVQCGLSLMVGAVFPLYFSCICLSCTIPTRHVQQGLMGLNLSQILILTVINLLPGLRSKWKNISHILNDLSSYYPASMAGCKERFNQKSIIDTRDQTTSQIAEDNSIDTSALITIQLHYTTALHCTIQITLLSC